MENNNSSTNEFAAGAQAPQLEAVPAPQNPPPVARITPTLAALTPAQKQQDVEEMTEKELAYIRGIEATNRQLTIDLGDAVLVMDAKKQVLAAHRVKMQEAYSNILRMRGIVEGRFDTNTGVIYALSRNG